MATESGLDARNRWCERLTEGLNVERKLLVVLQKVVEVLAHGPAGSDLAWRGQDARDRDLVRHCREQSETKLKIRSLAAGTYILTE